MYRNHPTSNKRCRIRSFVLSVLLSACALTASAQNETVRLSSRNLSVEEAFSQISRQAGYRFAYNLAGFDKNRTVAFPSESLTVKQALDRALAGSGYAYTIKDHYVMISKVPMTANTQAIAVSGDIPASVQRTGTVKPDTTLNYTINFRVGQSVLERGYMNNQRVMSDLEAILSDRSVLEKIEYISVIGSASPEGGQALNEKLSLARATSVRKWLVTKFPYLDADKILVYSIGEDWEGLRKMVAADAKVPSRDEVLSVIDGIENPTEREARLRQVDGGRAFAYLKTNMLPNLRGGAALGITYYDLAPAPEPKPAPAPAPAPKPAPAPAPKPVPAPAPAPAPIPEPEPACNTCKPLPIDLRTNLLYDAALLPTFGIEWHVSRGFGIKVDGGWAGWEFDGKDKIEKIRFVNPEFKFYLGDLKRLYVGLSGMIGHFNVKWGDTGHQGYMYNGGATVGYQLPVASHLSFDFNIGLGFWHLYYDDFYVENDTRYYQKKQIYKNFVGPTQAGISLVWHLGDTNKNR